MKECLYGCFLTVNATYISKCYLSFVHALVSFRLSLIAFSLSHTKPWLRYFFCQGFVSLISIMFQRTWLKLCCRFRCYCTSTNGITCSIQTTKCGFHIQYLQRLWKFFAWPQSDILVAVSVACGLVIDVLCPNLWSENILMFQSKLDQLITERDTAKRELYSSLREFVVKFEDIDALASAVTKIEVWLH